jgi:hypothetical protein
VTREDLVKLVEELWAPERLAVAGIGPDESHFDEAVSPIRPSLVEAAR